MPRLTKMFVEQSNLARPSSVWLHVNGVSLTTDMHPYQPPVHSYDYRTKHLQSPVPPSTPPLASSTTFAPYSITMIDGPYNNSHNDNNKQIQKLDNADMPKKFFVDRQIKKAKSLPGLIKGTALSRHTPFQSSTFPSPALINPPPNHIQDDQLPMVTLDNDDDSLPNAPTEAHRHHVYFADFNKIQLIEDNNESLSRHPTPTHHSHRRHRHRLTKKTSKTNGNNQISPSIQQRQILQNCSHPMSRQPAQELSIKKQPLFVSPRAQSSRTPHLPDILNQSIELPSNENSTKKYTLQREKPLTRLSKPFIEIPSGLRPSTPAEGTRENVIREPPTSNSRTQIPESELNESNNSSFARNTPSISQISGHRQRPSLRTISLRQQFTTPMKLKPSDVSTVGTTSTNYSSQQQLNNSLTTVRRSDSLHHTPLRAHDDVDHQQSSNGPTVATETNRPTTSTKSIKQLKRSDVIHINSKNSLGGHAINDSARLHVREATPKRFQNLLTVVRPPYASGNGTPSMRASPVLNDSTVQPSNQQHIKGIIRTTHTTSARELYGYHLESNTVFV